MAESIAMGGIGCKDDRYKNIKIVNPQNVVYLDAGFLVEVAAGSNITAEKAAEIAIDGDPTNPSDGTHGAMPSAVDNPYGMPHLDTLAISLVDKYPWLYQETSLSQTGVYRGTGNSLYNFLNSPLQLDTLTYNADMSNDLVAASNVNPAGVDYQYLDPNMKCKAPTLDKTCTSSTTATTVSTTPYLTRIIQDACTNQYILPMGLVPTYALDPIYRSHQMSYDESYCQSLMMVPVPCKRDLADTQGESTADAHSGATCLTDPGEAIDTLTSAVSTLSTGNFNLYAMAGAVGSKSLGKHNMYDYRAWAYLERAWKDVLASNYSPSNGKPNVLTIGSGKGMIVPPADATFQYFSAYGLPNGMSGSAFPDWKTTATTNIPPGENQPSTGTWGSATSNKYTGALTTINQLAIRPYERIFDSTHPFTPRWDMTGKTDRDMSSLTIMNPTPYLTGASTVVPTGYTILYTGCNVRCAAVPVDILTFRGAEFNSCMTCRINANSSCFWDEFILNNLLTINVFFPEYYNGNLLQMFADVNSGNSIYVTLGNFVPQLNDGSINVASGYLDHEIDFRCKSILQSKNYPKPAYNPWSQSGQWPPCSTDYEHPFDNHPGKMDYHTLYNDIIQTCGACLKKANDYADNLTPVRVAKEKGSTKNLRLSSVTKCCNDLAQPVAGVNMLKIRNLQDDPSLAAQVNTAFPEQTGSLTGPVQSPARVPEGYRFKDYFPSGNMPYMRWWDTGAAAGGPSGEALAADAPLYGLSSLPWVAAGVNMAWYDPLLGTNYDPNCDKGKDDMIVGVGTESTGSGSPAGLCRYGGGGGKPGANAWTYKCINVGNPDRLTSWLELKLYQVNSVRNFGLNCLPMQEKMWKWLGTEDGALHYAGRGFNTQWPEPGDNTHSTSEKKMNSWPLRWRGYLTDSQKTVSGSSGTYPYRFPNFDTGTGSATPPSGSVMTGLDNAQVGDIIYVYQDDDASVKGGIMPFAAVVTGAHNRNSAANSSCKGNSSCSDKNASCSNYIQIADMNVGKYPDACGNTDYIGMGQTRTIFKEWLPTDVQDVLFAGPGATMTDSCGDSHTIPATATTTSQTAAGYCADPRYAACTFNFAITGATTGASTDVMNKCATGTYSTTMSACTVNYWDQIHVYRPGLDERGDKTSGVAR